MTNFGRVAEILLASPQIGPYDGSRSPNGRRRDTAKNVGRRAGKGTSVEGFVSTPSAMLQPTNHAWSRPLCLDGRRDASRRSKPGRAL